MKSPIILDVMVAKFALGWGIQDFDRNECFDVENNLGHRRNSRVYLCNSKRSVHIHCVMLNSECRRKQTFNRRCKLNYNRVNHPNTNLYRSRIACSDAITSRNDTRKIKRWQKHSHSNEKMNLNISFIGYFGNDLKRICRVRIAK